jgi:uncharacterized protein YajQ (UPF0234 family)
MAGDSSFDVVSKIDRQEVDNAFNQAEKEIAQRYDFKGVGAAIEKSGEGFLMKASSEERVKAVLDVFIAKLAKRGISLKALDYGDPQPSGKGDGISATLKEGIAQDVAKKLTKLLRDEGPKSVRALPNNKAVSDAERPPEATESATTPRLRAANIEEMMPATEIHGVAEGRNSLSY